MLHRSQIFFWLLAGFLLGIFVASFFNVGQTFIYIGLIMALGLIAIFGYQKSFNRVGLLVGFLLVVFVFGIVRFNSANFNHNQLDLFTDLQAGQKNIEVTVNGYIDDEPVNNGNNQKIILRAKEIIAGDKKVLVNDRILITTSNFPKFNYGDAISVKGALQKPQNFGEFDYITYLKKENIRITMFYPTVRGEELKTGREKLDLGFREELKINLYKKIFLLKNKFESAVNKSVSEPNASFINGILLGSRQNIPDSLKEAFNKTGTTHILAISGYNIMIIVWAVLAGLIWFFRRRTAFWISVVVIILFVILTGASASVVRAAIMGLLVSFAGGYGRLYDTKNSIILAGAVMVWVNPFVLVFDVGFQLSFVAVLGLIYIFPRVNEKLRKIPKLGNVKELFLMTLSAQVAVSPLLIYYFGNFSLISLPTNVMILPFIPAAMLLGFASGLTGMILPIVGDVVGWFAWAVTTYQIEIVKIFAGF